MANQILSVEMNNNDDNNNNKNNKKNYNVPNYNKSSEPVDIKKILIFFGIAILAIGIVILGINGIKAISQAKDKEDLNYDDPKIECSEVTNGEIQVTINHENPITKLTYSWNGSEEIEIATNNKSYIVTSIPVPASGTNVLTLTTTDSNGKKASGQQTFTNDGIKIDYYKVGEQIKVVATDKNGMSSLTYQWNSDSSTKDTIQMAEDNTDKTTLEVLIDIPKGQNTLTILAENKVGNTRTRDIPVLGVEPPKIQIQKDGEYLVISVKDDSVITVIDYTLNAVRYRINLTAYDADYYNRIDGLTVKTNEEGKIIELEYRQLMTDKGENVIILNAENKQNGTATFSGKCTN